MKLNPRIRKDTFASDLEGDNLWFAIHKSGDDGHEFIVLSDWGADREHAIDRIDVAQKRCPHWLQANPVLRYEELKIIAVKLKR